MIVHCYHFNTIFFSTKALEITPALLHLPALAESPATAFAWSLVFPAMQPVVNQSGYCYTTMFCQFCLVLLDDYCLAEAPLPVRGAWPRGAWRRRFRGLLNGVKVLQPGASP
jgi:hypothetical protein